MDKQEVIERIKSFKRNAALHCLSNDDCKALDAAEALLTAQPSDSRLTAPARVGATQFNVGVPERLVIERAQREYEWHKNPPFPDIDIDKLRGAINALQPSGEGETK